jgi:hypothetical protein
LNPLISACKAVSRPDGTPGSIDRSFAVPPSGIEPAPSGLQPDAQTTYARGADGARRGNRTHLVPLDRRIASPDASASMTTERAGGRSRTSNLRFTKPLHYRLCYAGVRYCYSNVKDLRFTKRAHVDGSPRTPSAASSRRAHTRRALVGSCTRSGALRERCSATELRGQARAAEGSNLAATVLETVRCPASATQTIRPLAASMCRPRHACP